MSGQLAGRTVLIVEDNYLLASALQDAIEHLGAEVIGPFPGVSAALRSLESGASADVGLLDINLGSEMSFPIADELVRRGVPIIFLTGYDTEALPAPYRELPCLQKPIDLTRVCALLGTLGITAARSDTERR